MSLSWEHCPVPPSRPAGTGSSSRGISTSRAKKNLCSSMKKKKKKMSRMFSGPAPFPKKAIPPLCLRVLSKPSVNSLLGTSCCFRVLSVKSLSRYPNSSRNHPSLSLLTPKTTRGRRNSSPWFAWTIQPNKKGFREKEEHHFGAGFGWFRDTQDTHPQDVGRAAEAVDFPPQVEGDVGQLRDPLTVHHELQGQGTVLGQGQATSGDTGRAGCHSPLPRPPRWPRWLS